MFSHKCCWYSWYNENKLPVIFRVLNDLSPSAKDRIEEPGFFIDFHIISTKSVRFSKAELQKKVTDETAVWSLKLSD